MRTYKVLFSVLLLMSVFSLSLRADEPVGSNRPGVKSILKWLQTYIDSSSVKGVDQRYIEIPKKPWQIVVRSNINQSDLKMQSHINPEAYTGAEHGNLTWEPRVLTDITTYAGAWVGYRGFGFGFSKNVAGDKGSLFNIGLTSSKYSINLRIHRFETDNPKVRMAGTIQEDGSDEIDEYYFNEHFYILDPLKVKTVMFDGIYFFNGKKFSNLAAYDQSAIQRRSAGTPVVGMTMYYSKVNYDNDMNCDFIFFMNNIGRIKQWQASIGAGYAYNWVIGKNLMVNTTVMPTLSVYNRLKVYTYDNYWLQVALTDSDEDSLDDFTKWWIKPLDSKTVKGRMNLNIDARLSVTYNLKNWFFNVNGQFSNFHYKHDFTKGHLNDWYINASVGLRL